ncbi:unnamed protein product [Rotaria sp. Silwood1]|nr:unnamed protein product [Rotaria sp. Silwood1]CAF5017948.1 unnamed protein product [Rotaria sp. Silwood1]
MVKKSQHGTGDAVRVSLYSSQFNLMTEENFIGVTIYRYLRDIMNLYRPNGTVIIVGLRFLTNKGRQSELFGSSNGTKK